MLKSIHPKLPMRNKKETRDFYLEKLGFKDIGSFDYLEYLILSKDEIEVHFFLYPDLNPLENYGMVYIRVSEIEKLYLNLQYENIRFSGDGKLETKPWGQKEFSILDPNHNLLTFGEA